MSAGTMNTIAMWIGYWVLALIALGLFTGATMAFVQHSWRTLLRDVPRMDYLREAVAHYKTVKPAPGALREDD